MNILQRILFRVIRCAIDSRGQQEVTVRIIGNDGTETVYDGRASFFKMDWDTHMLRAPLALCVPMEPITHRLNLVISYAEPSK